MTRVISYTRFSTRRQASGDSYRRQTDMADAWCKKHGYALDTKMEDLGVSGFSGANAQSGALSELLKLALTGKIEPGTILLVEAFDRLTREALTDSLPYVMTLVNSGLVIITLNDEKRWTKETMNALEGLLLSSLQLQRGHDESARKADLLQKAFRAARKAGSQKPFGAAPGWLSRADPESPWIVTEELADVVRKVFDYAIKGYGSKRIAQIANDEGWPVPMRLNLTEGRWHGQMPAQMLRNRAVLGEHEHRIFTHDAKKQHWRGVSSGIEKSDYYPRIVSDELWYKARASIDTRMVKKRRDTHYFNIFSGLMFCGYCGAPTERKPGRVSDQRASLMCSHRNSDSAKECVTMMAPNADIPLLHAISEYSRATGLHPKDVDSGALQAIEAKIAEKTEATERVVDAIAGGLGGSKALQRKLEALEIEIDRATEELERAKLEIASADTGSLFDEDYSELRTYTDALYIVSDDARDLRAQLHVKLCRVVEHVWIWGYDAALINFKDGLQTLVRLSEKRLPSRERPDSKYHKPAAKRRTKPQPFYQLGLQNKLVPPEPKLTIAMKARKKVGYLVVEDEPESEYD